MPRGMARWQQGAAHATHFLLYLLMLVIPISGYFYSSAAGIQVVYLGIWPMPTIIGPDQELKGTLRIVHVVLNYGLLALVAVHVLAALKSKHCPQHSKPKKQDAGQLIRPDNRCVEYVAADDSHNFGA